MSSHRDNLNLICRGGPQPSAAGPSSALLLRIVDGGLAGVLFIIPFLLGGRHPLGQLILVLLAVITTLAWMLRQCLCTHAVWRPTWALPLLFAGAMLIFLQTIPLPQPLLERLAPH